MIKKICPQCKKNRELRFFSSRLTRYCVDCKRKKKNDRKREIRKNSIKTQDKAWALKVKERDGNKCCYCGKTEYLNAHHIFSRSKKSTRHLLENGITLCTGCHVFSSIFSAHKTPAEFIEWIKERNGEEWYNDLRYKASQMLTE